MILKVVQQDNRLLGIFTEDKIEAAITAFVESHGGIYKREDHLGETLIRCTDEALLIIDNWEVNKVLVKGQWTIL